MMRALKAGLVYGALLFAAGFVLGTVRVVALEGRVGALAAVLIEIPLMLAIAWRASRYAARRLAAPATPRARAAMGAAALGLLVGAETLLGLFAFGRTLAEQSAAFASPEGLAGLAAQGLAALFPAWRARAQSPA